MPMLTGGRYCCRVRMEWSRVEMSIHGTETSTNVLADLDPPLVWQLFERISRIPRCSKKEQKICAWIKAWGKQRNIPCASDAAGNLLLRRAAAPGREQVPVLVLQAHLDMVCVKAEGVQVNYDNDPIPIRVDGSGVRAVGTTLGADNGIGVAYCLAALIDPELICGPLEVLLTVDEEEGATGALGLKAGFSAVSLGIRGLAGGHSGMDIHLPRLNAVKLAVDALNKVREVLPVRLSRFDGGEADNSIPVRADCILLVPAESEDRALALLGQWRRETLDRARSSEPGLEIAIERGSATKAFSMEETDRICRLLTEIPHGPLAFSGEIEGLVESSSNLARVRSKADSFEINLSYRSSVESTLQKLSAKMKSIGERYGTQVKQHSRLPGWTANPTSAFSRLVKSHYSSALGRPVALKAFHAGLECGIFTRLDPELRMASIGPDIHAVHTPQEHVDIPSVALLWDVLRRIIAGMAELSEKGDEDE